MLELDGAPCGTCIQGHLRSRAYAPNTGILLSGHTLYVSDCIWGRTLHLSDQAPKTWDFVGTSQTACVPYWGSNWGGTLSNGGQKCIESNELLKTINFYNNRCHGEPLMDGTVKGVQQTNSEMSPERHAEYITNLFFIYCHRPNSDVLGPPRTPYCHYCRRKGSSVAPKCHKISRFVFYMVCRWHFTVWFSTIGTQTKKKTGI